MKERAPGLPFGMAESDAQKFIPETKHIKYHL